MERDRPADEPTLRIASSALCGRLRACSDGASWCSISTLATLAAPPRRGTILSLGGTAMVSVDAWRDNLSAGLFLAERPYGAPLDDVLTQALGYDPDTSGPVGQRERYERRFRRAQDLGQTKYHERTPGYFTIHAQPFGNTFLYRAVWYIWTNPESRVNQAVLVAHADFAAARHRRERDLATRERNVRGLAAADDLNQWGHAIARGDDRSALAIEASIVEGDALGELLTNRFGLPFAEMAPVLEKIAQRDAFTDVRLSFERDAKKLRRLRADMRKVERRVGDELIKWVNLRTGLPPDAQHRAIADARQRLEQIAG